MPEDKGKHRQSLCALHENKEIRAYNKHNKTRLYIMHYEQKNRQNVQNKNGEQGIIKVNSPEQAGEKVLELVNSGLSYRDISKKSSP